MNVERFVYLSALETIAETQDKKLALDLLNDWSSSSGLHRSLGRAAIEYLTGFVLPSLNGEDTAVKKIEPWIDEMLFHPPEAPQDIPSFLKLFEANYVETLSDRKMGGSKELDLLEIDWEKMVKEARDGNLGMHFCPLPIDGSERSEHSGSRKLDKNVRRFRVLYADFDGGPQKKPEHLLTIGLFEEPTICVETKNGFHVYYFLEEEISEEEWRRAQKAIIDLFGSDPNMKSPAHLLRLPFTWHCKTEEKFLVRVHSFHWRRFSKREIFHMFNVPSEVPRQQRKVFYMPFEPRGVRPPSLGVVTEGERHATLLEEAGRIYKGIAPEDAQNARDMLMFWYERSSKPLKQGWQREVNDICDWIERHEWGGITSMRRT